MTAVTIIMHVKPKMVKREGCYTEYDEDWWTSATSPKVLGNTQLTEILTNFDPEKLDRQMMNKLEVVIKDDDFTLANVTRACKAAEGKSPRPEFQSNFFKIL